MSWLIVKMWMLTFCSSSDCRGSCPGFESITMILISGLLQGVLMRRIASHEAINTYR